jgi:flagella basal body P-ring formation protein FlgA
MTDITAPCSETPKLAARCAALCAALCTGLGLALATAQAAAVTEAQIRLAVGAYYADAGDPIPFDAQSLKISPLPRFVEETPCSQLMIVPRGRVPALSLALSCEQPKPWRAYISARATTSSRIMTACRSLPRGTVLRAADLCPAQAAPGTGQLALTSSTEAVGLATKRPLGAGAVIYHHQLAPAVVVSRGDQVTIEAHRGAARISATGKAVGSGARGEQIDVINAASGRRLAVWVLGPGRTGTRAPGPDPAAAPPDFFESSAKVSKGTAVKGRRMPGNPGH